MAKRHWFATVALGVLATGSALADPPRELKRDYNSVETQINEIAETIAIQPERIYSPNSKCHDAMKQDDANLCAQWRAAIAAEDAAYWAKISNYVAAVGAVLSFLSIVFVVLALRYARQANQIAMTVGNAQVRSYVRVQGLNAPDPGDLTRAAGCRIGLTNVGLMPAIIDSIEAQGFTAEHPLPQSHVIPDAWMTLGRNIVLHHGDPADIVVQASQISAKEQASIRASEVLRLYYVAKVKYRDGVGRGYVEQVCFSVNFGQGHPRFEGASKHNNST